MWGFIFRIISYGNCDDQICVKTFTASSWWRDDEESFLRRKEFLSLARCSESSEGLLEFADARECFSTSRSRVRNSIFFLQTLCQIQNTANNAEAVAIKLRHKMSCRPHDICSYNQNICFSAAHPNTNEILHTLTRHLAKIFHRVSLSCSVFFLLVSPSCFRGDKFYCWNLRRVLAPLYIEFSWITFLKC